MNTQDASDHDKDDLSSFSETESDKDLTFKPPSCETKHCTNDGFGTYSKCSSTLCHAHILPEPGPCEKCHIIRREKKKVENLPKVKETKMSEIKFSFPKYNENAYDMRGPTTCEADLCTGDVYAACVKCLALLCYTHFIDTDPCEKHHIKEKETNQSKKLARECYLHTLEKGSLVPPLLEEAELNIGIGEGVNKRKTPEDYEVEGLQREEPIHITKKPNKRKDAHKKRLLGLEYISPHSKRVVHAKMIKERCNGEICKKNARKCYLFSEEDRKQLFQAYLNLGDIELQREYIARHIIQRETKQKTVKSTQSRRNKSNFYYLPISGEHLPVCKTMFLNTLSITEKSVRTSLAKIEETGILTSDRRDGCMEKCKVQDDERRCVKCLALLCHTHFIDRGSCEDCQIEEKETNQSEKLAEECYLHTLEKESLVPPMLEEAGLNIQIGGVNKTPEDYEVVGAQREEPVHITKKPNKRKDAHKKRLLGLEYISPHSKKVVHAKMIKERCNGEICKKNGRKCYLFSEEDRKQLFQAYLNLGDIQLQWEYIARHIVQKETKQKTVKSTQSRRSKSNFYHLPISGEHLPVCKTMFLNTLSITEKSVRTALAKIEETGILASDRRGGRVEKHKIQDDKRRQAILKHISRFPRVESHYCRKESKHEYLHPDLNLKKVVDMFNDEHKDVNIRASYNTYNSILKTQNISFFHPKKDQCSLCSTYKSGDEQKKAELEKVYYEYTMEEEKIRTIKKYLKGDPNPKKVYTVDDYIKDILN